MIILQGIKGYSGILMQWCVPKLLQIFAPLNQGES